jgi:hypothetical protein
VPNTEEAVLMLPKNLPPGDYTLALGWYTWPNQERLPLINSDYAWPGDRLPLGQITIFETETTP